MRILIGALTAADLQVRFQGPHAKDILVHTAE